MIVMEFDEYGFPIIEGVESKIIKFGLREQTAEELEELKKDIKVIPVDDSDD